MACPAHKVQSLAVTPHIPPSFPFPGWSALRVFLVKEGVHGSSFAPLRTDLMHLSWKLKKILDHHVFEKLGAFLIGKLSSGSVSGRSGGSVHG